MDSTHHVNKSMLA